jgi:hypothetical protein
MKLKRKTNKQQNEFNENAKKQLNELKEDTKS